MNTTKAQTRVYTYPGNEATWDPQSPLLWGGKFSGGYRFTLRNDSTSMALASKTCVLMSSKRCSSLGAAPRSSAVAIHRASIGRGGNRGFEVSTISSTLCRANRGGNERDRQDGVVAWFNVL